MEKCGESRRLAVQKVVAFARRKVMFARMKKYHSIFGNLEAPKEIDLNSIR